MNLHCILIALVAIHMPIQAAAQTVPATRPLEASGDLAAQMVAGIDAFLMRATEESVKERAAF